MKTVLIVLAVLLLVGCAIALMYRKTQQKNRDRAGELRHEAQGRSAELRTDETRVRASDAGAAQARAEAEAKTAEANRLEAQANESRGGLEVQRGQQEDAIRSADQIDPDVDHTSPNYHPEVPETQPGGATTRP